MAVQTAASFRSQSQDGETEWQDEKADISREFCCFLCNGIMVVQGKITLEPAFIRLSTANG